MTQAEVILTPSRSKGDGVQLPSGTVTLLFTDIEGSTLSFEMRPMPASERGQEAAALRSARFSVPLKIFIGRLDSGIPPSRPTSHVSCM